MSADANVGANISREQRGLGNRTKMSEELLRDSDR